MISDTAFRLCPAPWEAEPRHLWSLLDMLRFYAKNFTAVMLNLERANGGLLAYSDMEDQRPNVFFHLAHAYNELLELPVSRSLREQVRRAMEAPEDSDITYLYARVGEIEHNVVEELASHLFLCVPEPESSPFTEPYQWFGVEVLKSFPDARRDIRDCGRCLSLDLWTAAVYHAMCVVQHGLHKLCDDLGVTFNKDFEALQWNDILTGVDSRLKKMRGDPQTSQLTALIHLGAKASSHFFSIREAWRNYVMHGKEHYDADEARSVVDAVRSIMVALS